MFWGVNKRLCQLLELPSSLLLFMYHVVPDCVVRSGVFSSVDVVGSCMRASTVTDP